MILVKFGYLLCISTSFWVLCAPESWSNYFSAVFKLFCSINFIEMSKKSGKKLESVQEFTPKCWLIVFVSNNQKTSFFFEISIKFIEFQRHSRFLLHSWFISTNALFGGAVSNRWSKFTTFGLRLWRTLSSSNNGVVTDKKEGCHWPFASPG